MGGGTDTVKAADIVPTQVCAQKSVQGHHSHDYSIKVGTKLERGKATDAADLD